MSFGGGHAFYEDDDYHTDPGQPLEDEYEETMYQNEEFERLLKRYDEIITSMRKANDMPEEDAHRRELEKVYDEASRML